MALAALNIATTIGITTSLPARPPNCVDIASAAMRSLFAATSGPNALTYPALARQYNTMRITVPATIPRGNVRCGLIVSPAENVTNCQPSYAQSTPIIAVGNAE